MEHQKGIVTTAAKAATWEVVMPLLQAMYEEFKELSKKKPEAALSKGKVSVVNRLLGKCREVLAGEASLEFLDLLNEDNFPQQSDVVISLSQYVAAMKAFHERYYGWDGMHNSWAIAKGK